MAEGSGTWEEPRTPLAAVASNNVTATLPTPQESALQELWLRILELTSTAPLSSSVTLPSKATGYSQAQSSAHAHRMPASGLPANGLSATAANRTQQRSRKHDHWRLNPLELHHGIYEATRCFSADWWVSYYLRANNNDVVSALDDLLRHVHWRRRIAKVDSDLLPWGEAGAWRTVQNPDADPRERRIAEGFLSILQNEEARILKGTDRLGRIICFIKVKNHRAGLYPAESYERYLAWHCEISRMMMPETRGDGILLLDFEGYRVQNFDWRPLKIITKIMKDYYPQGLGDVIMHRAPALFTPVWLLIKRVIREDYYSHIHFTKNLTDLRRYLSYQTIPADMGGGDDSEYHYSPPDLDDPINGGGGESVQIRREYERRMLQEQHMETARLFEETTREWIDASRRGRETSGLNSLRARYQQDLLAMYWKLDPYIRSRSIYDRLGWIQPPEWALE
ncbi:MAG: hypothetical protein Q9162_001168 [Coniocarpon cinnabarinum]